MTTKIRAPLHYGYPLLTGKERLLVWRRAQQVWKRHRWHAIRELKKYAENGSENYLLRHHAVYTFDTNVIIYYLDQDKRIMPPVRDIFERNSPVYVSAISEIELFGFSRLTDIEAMEIDGILRTVSLIPVDSRIARIAAALRRIYGLKVADSAIAATALFTGSTLVTRNVKDFKRVPELKLQHV